MIARPLHLERTPQPQRTARAWLLDGGDPARWLAEIARWRVAEETLTLHVLPRSRTDRAAAGLFVIVPVGAKPAVVPAALAFGALAECCWLPVDAVLRPAVSTVEADAWGGGEALVFHPALGPVLLPGDAALHVADLLFAPPPVSRNWRAAPLLPTAHSRIESIGFRPTLSLAEVFGEEGRGIGGDSPEELPPVEGEFSKHPLARRLRAIHYGMLRASEWSVKNLPGGQAADALAQWLEKQLAEMARRLALTRNASLQRLLEQLQSDPDEGLRHALPLGGNALHRGVAPPSADLGTRGTDFDLRRLGGGRPRDRWEVSEGIRTQLRQRYVELAERERLLGRYRRAACIYAELLGDLHAAAAVLMEGKYWQEAAIVYRDHLSKDLEAARCFAEGRMYAEAVKIYEARDAFESLGELHRALGDEEKARAAFSKWAAQLHEKRNLLGAAHVLETKLDERAKALELLENGARTSPQMIGCIARLFDMRGPAGEHAEMARFLVSVAMGPVSQDLAALLDVLAVAQRSYPDRQIRAQVDDLGRRLLAPRLSLPHRIDHAELMQKLAALAPEDPLLGPDAHRFLDRTRGQGRPVPAAPALPSQPGTATVRLLSQAWLPRPLTSWRLASAARDGVLILGVLHQTRVRVIRVHWDGTMQEAEWRLKLPNAALQGLLLATSPEGQPEAAFAAVAGDGLLDALSLPAHESFPNALKVGLPPWVAPQPLAAVIASDRTLWVLHARPDGNMLTGYLPDGRFCGNFTTPLPLDATGQAHTPLLAISGVELLLAQVTRLHRFRHASEMGADETSAPLEFEGCITALIPSPRWATPHVALALQREVQVCWLGPHAGRCHRVIAEVDDPVIGFSGDGTLIVISDGTGWLLDCSNRGKCRRATFHWTREKPLAIVPGPTARSFGVVSRVGRVDWIGFSPDDLRDTGASFR